MLLKELFTNPMDFEKSEQDIDWLDDLKVFLDNDDETLSKYFFPAVDKHKQDPDNQDAFKLYIKPISACADKYCETYQLPERNAFFPPEKIIELAKKIASEQKTYIERGDYK